MILSKRWTTLEAIMALAGLINLIMPMSAAIDANCDYYQNVALGQRYYIYSPGYPNRYRGGTTCRWVGQGDPNSQIVLSCEVIDIPASQNCQQDRLAISRSGDPNFRDAHNYCGKGTLSLVSEANKLAIGLFSSWYSSGGKFLCTVTAIQGNNPTTTTQPPPICDCGWKQERRIVGGQETGINEFPSMAGLVDMPNRELFCGATIISSKYALSAAHCFQNRKISDLGLLVGDHNIETGLDTASAALYLLEKTEVHPGYNTTTRENDIAVVKTQNLIAFSSNVGPVCLPFRYSNYDFNGFTVIALGWGTLEFSGPKSDTLQKVDLSVVTNGHCQKELTDNIIFNSEICTYAPGKDACQYDSGGPILWFDLNTRRLQLVGIISYGIACAADFPSVNTRVTSYLAWIVSVTSDLDTTSAARYLLEKTEVHPGYNTTTRENDIAVVKTQNLIAFSSNVGPVCLPFRYSNYDFNGFTVTALGWGTLEFSGPKSDTLQKVDLSVVTNGHCQKELTDNIIFNSEICTYAPGKDACQFDSGGPILWFDLNTRRLELVGIISYGIACAADFPSVNTRVTSYLAWIVSVTSDAEYCIK